jgi:hypothetical protein
MANAKNESFKLRQRIEKEQNERDKEMERIRTAMPFQVIIILGRDSPPLKYFYSNGTGTT